MIGRTIGNYTITDKIGEGGMGVVYVAEHPRIGRRVAIKTLHPQFGKVPEVVRRFFTEAKAAHEIRHPNIIDVLDFGELEDGTSYFIMEWLDGQSLKAALERQPVFSLSRTAHVADGVLRALVAAHAHGVVHRDLKPDNIYLIKHEDDPDFVKVLDFGIAKLTGAREDDAHRTGTGVVMGTPAFMSPEQCRGDRTLDGRSDIYSLGLIVYVMLVGRMPFEAKSMGEFMAAHLNSEPVPPRTVNPAIPVAVEAVVLRALEKDRQKRFQTALEFRDALQVAVGSTPPRVSEAEMMTLMPTGEAAPLSTGPAHQTADLVGGPVTNPSTTLSGSTAEVQARSRIVRRRTSLVVGGAVGVAALVAGFAVTRSHPAPSSAPIAASPASGSSGTGAPSGSGAPATPPPPVIPAAAAPAVTPSPVARASISLRVRALPPETTLLLDGAAISNPFDGKFDNSDTRHRLEAAAPGYRAESDWVVFDHDQQFDFKLQRGPGKREREHVGEAKKARPAVAAPGYRGTKGTLVTDFPDK